MAEFSGKAARCEGGRKFSWKKVVLEAGRNTPFRILYQCQQDLLVPMKWSSRSDAGKNPRCD